MACTGEFNLFQCVNQVDCQHIFCLGCMLPTMLNTTTAYVTCPKCFSFSAGSVESVPNKIILPMNETKTLYFACYPRRTFDEAIANVSYYYWINHEDAEAVVYFQCFKKFVFNVVTLLCLPVCVILQYVINGSFN